MRRLPILFLAILLLSCENESCEDWKEPIPEHAADPDFMLIAGESVHDSINYYQYNPVVKILGPRFGTDSNYFYLDSMAIDLNNDGDNDLLFRYDQHFVQPSCDCEGLDCCMPWGGASCRVEILSNLEIAGTEYYGLNPDRLQFGDTIDSRRTWIKDKARYLFDAWGMTESPWQVNYYNSFMGLRFIQETDTLYGWIRMNTAYANRIEIYDYVLEK